MSNENGFAYNRSDGHANVTRIIVAHGEFIRQLRREHQQVAIYVSGKVLVDPDIYRNKELVLTHPVEVMDMRGGVENMLYLLTDTVYPAGHPQASERLVYGVSPTPETVLEFVDMEYEPLSGTPQPLVIPDQMKQKLFALKPSVQTCKPDTKQGKEPPDLLLTPLQDLTDAMLERALQHTISREATTTPGTPEHDQAAARKAAVIQEMANRPLRREQQKAAKEQKREQQKAITAQISVWRTRLNEIQKALAQAAALQDEEQIETLKAALVDYARYISQLEQQREAVKQGFEWPPADLDLVEEPVHAIEQQEVISG